MLDFLPAGAIDAAAQHCSARPWLRWAYLNRNVVLLADLANQNNRAFPAGLKHRLAAIVLAGKAKVVHGLCLRIFRWVVLQREGARSKFMQRVFLIVANALVEASFFFFKTVLLELEFCIFRSELNVRLQLNKGGVIHGD